MLLKDALVKIKTENLFDDLIDYMYSNIYSHFYEPVEKEEINENFKKLIDSLLLLEPNESLLASIGAIKTMNYDAEMDDDLHYITTAPIKYYETFDVFSIYVDDPERYSLMFTDWRNLINADILDKCINRYGLIPVLANVLYEISWEGYDYESAKEKSESIIAELNASVEEIDGHPERLHDFDSIRDELGIPETTDEEKAFLRKTYEYISEEYMKESLILFGDRTKKTQEN